MEQQPTFEFLSASLGNLFSKQKIEIQNLKNENDQLRLDNDELQKDNENYQENWIDGDNIKEIDCGIGTIQYLQPDNLKLQIVMEELKERMEHKAMFA